MEESAPASLDELLDSIGNTNPRLRLMAEFIRRREAIASEDRASVARRKRFRNKIRKLIRNYEKLMETNQVLASALGACPNCWGQDETCECEGHGKPGSKRSDESAFAEFVLPAIKKFGWVRKEDQSE